MSSRKYTKQEEEFIIKNMDIMTPEQISNELNISKYSIVGKIIALRSGTSVNNSLYIKDKNGKYKYTDEENKFIEDNLYNYSIKEFSKILNKPYQSLSSKIGQLKKCKKFNCDSISDFNKKKEAIKNSEFCKIENAKKKLDNVELKVVHKKHKKPAKKQPNIWSDDEIEFLKNNYKSHSRREIAELLNKTENNVRTKLADLNLKKTKKTGAAYKWNEREEDFIRLICESEVLSRKEKLLILNENLNNRTEYAIKRKAIDLGYKDKVSKCRNDRTNIETIIEKFLIANNIKFESQVNKTIEGNTFIFDFVINNKIIEVNGDYWHCNPNIYVNGPKDSIQIKKMKKDETKRKVLRENNIELLEIWENDIHLNLNEVKNKILEFLK